MSQPAHKIRFGVLQVTIWRNTSDKGTWYSAVPARSYKKGDETWAESDSLNADDLRLIGRCIPQRVRSTDDREAHEVVVRRRRRRSPFERVGAPRIRSGIRAVASADREVDEHRQNRQHDQHRAR